MPVTFRTSSGGSPSDYVRRLTDAALPTQGDLVYAGQRQRGRILKRTTELGVDSNGTAFTPYNSTRPYTWYPGGPAGKLRSSKSRKASVRRYVKIIGNVEHGRGEDLGGVPTKSGLGIRFPSYDAFKKSLGRSIVDLMGPMARMVKAVVVKVTGGPIVSGGDQTVGVNSMPQKASTVIVGIYGDEAVRGEGHNNGIPGKLPRRHWFDNGPRDLAEMENDIIVRRSAVIKGIKE